MAPHIQTPDILRLIIAILLPPLGVFLQVGLSKHFFINLLLTLMAYVPGLIHALWVVLSRRSAAPAPV